MRAIVQRVSSASVTGEQCWRGGGFEDCRGLDGASGTGSSVDDTAYDMDIVAQKILNIKAFPDANSGGQWKCSVMDRGGEVLSVSQFTLYAKLNKNKPDFHKSMPAESSSSMYATFLERMGELYDPNKIKDGKFGAMMSVALTNEGPVTFIIDSRSETSDAGPNGGSGSQSGKSTPQQSTGSVTTVAQKAAEKALRKAAWEAAKKQQAQDKSIASGDSAITQ